MREDPLYTVYIYTPDRPPARRSVDLAVMFLGYELDSQNTEHYKHTEELNLGLRTEGLGDLNSGY